MCLPFWALLLSVGDAAFAIETNVVLSVYQGVCKEGDFTGNLATTREVVKQARERGSHFLALPECFLSGYESREVVQRGARSVDDPELKAFVAESAGHEMVIIAGLARKAGDALYNSVLVIHCGRLLGFYDKIMLTESDRDSLGFSPGTSVPVFQAHGVRFGVIICHDSSFPHAALAARLQGAQILFSPHYNEIPANSADDHRRSVRNCHIGLACQLGMVVARANIVRSDRPGQISYGDSFILSPQGAALAEANLFKTELITTTISPAMLKSRWADLAEVPSWLRQQLGHMLTEFRRPRDEANERFWLENMVVFHHFKPAEINAATGLTLEEISNAVSNSGLAEKPWPPSQPSEVLRVMPYPGGRHPRLGFFDGAYMPQRETKVSVFTPWENGGYVVVDLPEAIFSNLGLLYLAHTDIPTVWDKHGITLPRLEWERGAGGTLKSERRLPNGVTFGAKVNPTLTEIRMHLWLHNGTAEKLSGLRVQNCVLLGYAPLFNNQTLTNKVFQSPYAAAASADRAHWVITAWEPVQRCWGNEDCPCVHSDPQFPDCPPGETTHARGWLSFYEGTNLVSELRRIDATGWRDVVSGD
jgi:predicted amidohydrolase